MEAKSPRCVLCSEAEGDQKLRRVEVWRDALWRVTVSLESEVAGLSYLEPRRHIPTIAELGGEEARSFGVVLPRVAGVLREATDAEAMFLYVFGTGVPHLHVHLAPHRTGDALNAQLIKGEVTAQTLPSGAKRLVSAEYPLIPEEELLRLSEVVRERLAPE